MKRGFLTFVRVLLMPGLRSDTWPHVCLRPAVRRAAWAEVCGGDVGSAWMSPQASGRVSRPGVLYQRRVAAISVPKEAADSGGGCDILCSCENEGGLLGAGVGQGRSAVSLRGNEGYIVKSKAKNISCRGICICVYIKCIRKEKPRGVADGGLPRSHWGLPINPITW